MRKTLLIPLLVSAMCLLAVEPALTQQAWDTLQEYEKATGEKIEKFNEPPMLKVKVAAGELPPVEERLPEEPQVIEPLEEVGRYGGTMHLIGIYPGGEMEGTVRRMATLTYDCSRIIPCVAKGWNLSDDYKTLTLYLRKGMKWSDGEPFTADDVLFWYEDIILNDELTPTKPKKWCPGGEPMKARKVDDYTVQFEFSIPYPTAIETLVSMPASYPKHYLKKYHIKYNPDADKIAKQEGYDSWWQCIQSHYEEEAGQYYDLNIPVITPWVLKKRDAAQNSYWERNPYYWRVDTTGNQLPYIDKVMYMNVATPEVVAMKSMSGEVDCNRGYLSFSDFPVYKRNEKAGGYKVYLVPTMDSATALSYAFNYNHKDPVLKKIFNDIRFRQATSLAINREEISKTVFFGKLRPWTAPVASNWTGFEDWMGTYFAEYDPQRANQLLDEMGLKWDKDHQYRLRPDGKTLQIVGEYCLEWLGEYPGKVIELIKEYWKDIGIKLIAKQVRENLVMERMRAGEHDLCFWNADGCSEILARCNYPIRLMPPWHWAGIPMGGSEWRKWYDTNGKEGEEPPEEIKKIFNLVDEWLATPRGAKKYVKLTKELISLNVKGLYLIGTVEACPYPSIIKNGLRNVRRENALFAWRGTYGFYMMEQFFFEK